VELSAARARSTWGDGGLMKFAGRKPPAQLGAVLHRADPVKLAARKTPARAPPVKFAAPRTAAASGSYPAGQWTMP